MRSAREKKTHGYANPVYRNVDDSIHACAEVFLLVVLVPRRHSFVTIMES